MVGDEKVGLVVLVVLLIKLVVVGVIILPCFVVVVVLVFAVGMLITVDSSNSHLQKDKGQSN